MKLSSLIICLLFVMQIFGQTPRFGVKASGMLSVVSEDLFSLYAPGYQAGITGDFPLSKFYTLGVEATFQMRRTSWTAYGWYDGDNVQEDYIEIERTNYMMLNFSLPNKLKLNDRFSVFASPEFSLALGEIHVDADKYWEYDPATGSEIETNDRNVHTQMYEQIEFIIGASVGVEYAVLPSLSLELRYQHDIIPRVEGYWALTQLGLHYYFDFGKKDAH